jgi:hypothetical protein
MHVERFDPRHAGSYTVQNRDNRQTCLQVVLIDNSHQIMFLHSMRKTNETSCKSCVNRGLAMPH